MIDLNLDTKCRIDFTSNFKKHLKKAIRQNKNIDELLIVIVKLANKEKLDIKYRNHDLINDKTYKECSECHIRPDWLLIYKYVDDKLVLVLFAIVLIVNFLANDFVVNNYRKDSFLLVLK